MIYLLKKHCKGITQNPIGVILERLICADGGEKDYLVIISEKIFNKDLSLENAIDVVYNDVIINS